jgi:phosphoglycolate phosphatase
LVQRLGEEAGLTPAAAARRVVTFDLDGTLADTAGEIARAADAALVDLSQRAAGLAAVRACVGGGGRVLMQRLLARASGEAPDAETLDRAFGAFQRHYGAFAGTACPPYPGALACVRRLAEAGVALGCVTNKDEAFARTVLAAAGFDPFFPLVVGGDTLPFRKPDGRVLRHAVASLGGTPATALHVGDSRTDLEAARAAGVACWLVTFGYDADAPVAGLGADRLVDAFDGIAAALLPG